MTTPNVATVWEAFTTTECSNVTVLFCGTALPATTMWNFLTATCPADVPIYFSYANFGFLCPNGQFGIQWFNLPAGTYYLPIYCTPSGGAYSVDVSAATCIPGPTNDDCTGATELPVNTTCEPFDGSVENGTFSFPSPGCNEAVGNPNDDVWFSFVATGTAHTIEVDGLGTDLDVVIELFGGGCGSTTPIACVDDGLNGDVETLVADGLQVGAAYRFRVFHYYTALADNPEFTVCVTGDVATVLPTNDDRSITVRPTITDDMVNILDAQVGSTFRVLDRTGRSVVEGRLTGARHVVDLSAHPTGAYVVVVNTTDGRSHRSVVVRQ